MVFEDLKALVSSSLDDPVVYTVGRRWTRSMWLDLGRVVSRSLAAGTGSKSHNDSKTRMFPKSDFPLLIR